jgi:hypothetical protein
MGWVGEEKIEAEKKKAARPAKGKGSNQEKCTQLFAK